MNYIISDFLSTRDKFINFFFLKTGVDLSVCQSLTYPPSETYRRSLCRPHDVRELEEDNKRKVKLLPRR